MRIGRESTQIHDSETKPYLTCWDCVRFSIDRPRFDGYDVRMEHEITQMTQFSNQARCSKCGPSVWVLKRGARKVTDVVCSNSEEAREKRKVHHGLTPSEAKDRCKGRSCEICGNSDDASLCVDHNHENGALRGILCKKCNTGLGMLGDGNDREIIRSLVKYVCKYPTS